MEAAPLFNKPPAVSKPLLAADEVQAPSLDSGLQPRPMEVPHIRASASGSKRNTPKQLRPPSAPARRPNGEPTVGEVRAAGSCAPVSFFNFIGHQLLIGVDETVTAEMEEESARRRRKGVYHFLRAPWELEKLLLLGYLVCLDSFLFMVTMLPVRVAASLFTLAVRRRISWLQICDVMCVGAIVIAVYALGQIDTSQAYHSVKGQAVIKLYVVFNVLEVFDKLCASFGQDILHTLFWSSMARRTWKGHLLLDFIIVAVYLVVHSCVLFYQVVSLNVAVNSHNNVMLTLLVSNNFVELKSNVFKRFEPDNLFVLACSDMIERFQLTCYLLIVSLHVLTVHADSVVLANVLGAIGMVSAAELLVDWIKHAFVIKFNGIQPTIYRRFHSVLCRDLANSVAGGHEDRQAGPHMLQSGAAASTRIGFSCIPLLCLVLRSIGQFVRWLQLLSSPTGLLILALSWLLLCLVKALLSVALTGYACEQALSTPAGAHGRPAAAGAGDSPGLQKEASYTAEWLGEVAAAAGPMPSASAPAIGAGIQPPRSPTSRLSDAATSPSLRAREGLSVAVDTGQQASPPNQHNGRPMTTPAARPRPTAFAGYQASGSDARLRVSADGLINRRNGNSMGSPSSPFGADHLMLESASRPARHGIPSIESSAEL